jgi:hypothetical protein
MSMIHETADSRLVPARGNRYDDDLWALIYDLYAFEEDQNATRTRRNLIEKIRSSLPDDADDVDDESLNIPTVRQIQKRSRDEQWGKRAASDIAKVAPHLYKASLSRLFAQIEAAQRFDGDVLAGQYDHFRSPGVLAIKERVAARVLTLSKEIVEAGMGALLASTETIETPSAELSKEELGNRMREKLMAVREGRR